MPSNARMESGFVTPGSSTTMRSVPWVCTRGSETPVLLTRRSMMSRMVARSAAVALTPSTGCTWYSTRSPPRRSRPSLVSIGRVPPAVPLAGRLRFGSRSIASASSAVARIRYGVNLRIAENPSRGEHQPCSAAVSAEGGQDPCGKGVIYPWDLGQCLKRCGGNPRC